MRQVNLRNLLARGVRKTTRLAAPLVPANAPSSDAPVKYLPASNYPESNIPEKHREVIDLSKGGMPEGVTLKRALGRNCVLIRDKRHLTQDLKMIINPSPKHKRPANVQIEIGKLEGKLFFQVIGGDSKAQFGYCRSIFGHIDMGVDSILNVGDNTSVGHMRVMSARGEVTIGEDCMFGGQVVLNAGIHHAIVDLNDDKPEMVPQRMSMIVGDHVWLCHQSYLVGRANIGSGCIVAARSVVANDVPDNCLVAGNPGVVKKRNVTWARPPGRIDDMSQHYIDSLYA